MIMNERMRMKMSNNPQMQTVRAVPASEEIHRILEERAKVHGHFGRNAEVIQQVKRALRDLNESEFAGLRMSSVQAEALEAIVCKIVRIAGGNPNDPDHWVDIMGYAQLALNSMD